MRFQKILVALDFSEPSRNALRTAIELATDGNAELVLAHVWQPAGYAYGGAPFPTSVLDGYMKEARQALDEWRREAERGGATRVETQLLDGTPWHEIVQLALVDAAIDLIVIGTHGHTGLKHVLLGSVAERIVRHAPCPVLVVRARG